ncbi:MAG: hypothetical protein LBH59_05045 [Planctomycetaceae bacterium]|nr:hypothetical protein [Planctomycetaceae bacterium]
MDNTNHRTSNVSKQQIINITDTEAGFALEQTLHVVTLTVFSYVDFKGASAYMIF